MGHLESELRLYAPWVNQCVSRMLRRLPPNVLREDLLSAGTVGLLYALRKSPHRDPRFEAYARTCIHGAVIDELRRSDWVNRRRRMQIKQGLVVHSTVSFDDLPPGFDLPDASSLKGFERVDGRNELAAPLKTLRPRDVEILRLHYLEGLPFVEIAARLKVSEPRVSQLHTRALQRLHAVMIGPRAALTRVTPSPPAPAAPPPQRKPRGPRGLGMRTRAQLERARRLRVEGFSLREIVEVTGLSKETVMRHTPVVPRAEAMRRKHVRWKARGTPVLPPWRRARPE